MDSKTRRLESLERMILHPNTPENERTVAIGRWEAIAGQKWSGKAQYSSSSGDSSQKRYKADTSYRGDAYSDAFNEFFKNFGGFSWDDYSSAYEQMKREQQKREEEKRERNRRDNERAKQERERSYTQSDDGTYEFNFKNFHYDFTGISQCSEKQYNYIGMICNFFRWKYPPREDIDFDEAKEFLNKYSSIYQLFVANTRNFQNLKRVFEALGINWNQTKRTWNWKVYGEV